MNKVKLTCYDCIHYHVCKYWDNWSKPFPYKDDSYIKNYLTKLTETLATACNHFEKRNIT